MGSWKKMSRRRSLRVIGAGGLSLGLLGVAGCGGEEEGGGGSGGGGGGEGCATPVDAQSTQMRSTLQYVEQSQVEGKNCENCAQYVADQYGECGGCNVITGPVRPQGYCLSWAALGEGGEEGEAPAAGEEAAGETEG